MSDSYDRREFAKRAVLTSLAAGSIARTSAEAQESGQPDSPTPGKPEELLREIIRQQYPSEQLTEEILNQIQRDIFRHRTRGRALKSVPLTNGEAPFVFQAYRSADESVTESIRIQPRKAPERTE